MRCRIIRKTQKGTIILTTIHIGFCGVFFSGFCCYRLLYKRASENVYCRVSIVQAFYRISIEFCDKVFRLFWVQVKATTRKITRLVKEGPGRTKRTYTDIPNGPKQPHSTEQGLHKDSLFSSVLQCHPAPPPPHVLCLGSLGQRLRGVVRFGQ